MRVQRASRLARIHQLRNGQWSAEVRADPHAPWRVLAVKPKREDAWATLFDRLN
jgi:hypothetical protein